MRTVSLPGCPRFKGSSTTIASRFTESAARFGGEAVTFGKNRLAYRGCRGCYDCSKGLEECVLQVNTDDARFAHIFPGCELFLKWPGSQETSLIRFCRIGPASVDGVPERVPRQAEEATRTIMV